MKEGFQQLSKQLEQMNESLKKIIEFRDFTQHVHDHQTDSAADADSNCPAFWHFFLPPDHHEHTPSVQSPGYSDCFKIILLFLILIRIDDRYGDGWNEILFEDRFGDGWHD